MKLIKGDNLTASQRREVLARYIYRWTIENRQRTHAWRRMDGRPTMPLETDAAWLSSHAFHITDKGVLSDRHSHCESVYMADDDEGSES